MYIGNFNFKIFFGAVLIMLLMIIGLFWNLAKADDYSQYTNEQIVNAIYFAEGSERAIKPFGILSIKCEGYNECKQICLNSVKNGRKRWIKAGKPCDLIEFISRRYCPIGANNDNGTNKYWAKNVKWWLKNE